MSALAGNRDLDRSVARVLTAGTYVSIALLAVGVVLMLAAGRSVLALDFPGLEPARILADLGSIRPEGFLWLGLVAVVATPSLRVAASLVGYVHERDRRMSLVSIGILAIIGASIVLSATRG